MELTKEEIDRISWKFLLFAGSADVSAIVHKETLRDIKNLKKLDKAWRQLSEDGRDAIEVMLACFASPRMKEGGPLAVDPDCIDVGRAIRWVIEGGTRRAGSPVKLPGLLDATLETVRIWQARNPDRSVEVGQFHRETKAHDTPYHPYPLMVFVADALTKVLSRRDWVLATGMKRPELLDR